MIREIDIRNKNRQEGLDIMLPITELERKDILEELGTTEPEQYEIGYGMKCSLPSELQTRNGSLEELNCIVVMWERMDEIQREVLINLGSMIFTYIFAAIIYVINDGLFYAH